MPIDIQNTCIEIPTNDSSKDGYRRISIGNKMVYLHRYICEQVAGRPMLDTEVARHTCHNGRCINPHHLIPGTQLDNVRDTRKAGRFKYGTSIGEKHGMASISESTAKRVVALLPLGMTAQQIADYLKISKNVVNQIRSGKTWKHLPRV